LTKWNPGRAKRSRNKRQKLVNQQEILIPCQGGQATLMLHIYETYWKGFIHYTPDGGKRSEVGEVYFNFTRGPLGVLLEVLHKCIDRFLEEMGEPETALNHPKVA
jgi:hypothetical protein